MKEIREKKVIDAVSSLCLKANTEIRNDVQKALEKAFTFEKETQAKKALEEILESIKISKREKMPLCQDCGTVTVFLEIGDKVILRGNWEEAVNKGITKAYDSGYLRKSIVDDPLFERKNTETNTPAQIYYSYIKGNKVKIDVIVKGAGSENVSFLRMLNPSDGVSGAKEIIIKEVIKRAPFSCPPIVLGIGIGGTFDGAAVLSKKALLKSINDINEDKKLALMEKELMAEINNMGLGAAGLKGKTVLLGVNILTKATHMASLPVAISINCWALRSINAVI